MKVTIVGLGGTGSHLVTPLIRYMKSQMLFEPKGILFVDGDAFEDGNVERQDFMPSYSGVNKAQYACLKHQKIFPDSKDTFHFMDKYAGEEDLPRLMPDYGVMFVCVDNYFFRKIVDKYIAGMTYYSVICGGNEMLDGQVQIVQQSEGRNITGQTICSRHKEIEKSSKEDDRASMSCEAIAELPSGGQVIVANMMSATLMLSYFVNYCGNTHERKFFETFFDCKDNSMRTLNVKK